jgi:hypothetical protein
MSNKIKHLELITSVINRLANNSVLLKGWSITLFVVFFSIQSSTIPFASFLLMLFFILGFGLLDIYYLYLERAYRDLYEEVRNRSNEEIDFSMIVSKYKNRKNFISTIISPSVSMFYIFFIIISIVLLITL